MSDRKKLEAEAVECGFSEKEAKNAPNMKALEEMVEAGPAPKDDDKAAGPDAPAENGKGDDKGEGKAPEPTEEEKAAAAPKEAGEKSAAAQKAQSDKDSADDKKKIAEEEAAKKLEDLEAEEEAKEQAAADKKAACKYEEGKPYDFRVNSNLKRNGKSYSKGDALKCNFDKEVCSLLLDGVLSAK